jgi:hypothetical protein
MTVPMGHGSSQIVKLQKHGDFVLMDAFTTLYTAMMGPLTDLLIKGLFFLLVFQSLGFFWFVWVVLRFGLLRRDEPQGEDHG